MCNFVVRVNVLFVFFSFPLVCFVVSSRLPPQIMKNVKASKISDRTCVLHSTYQPILITTMWMRQNYGCIDNRIRMPMMRNRFWSAKLKVGTRKKSTNHLPYTMPTVQVSQLKQCQSRHTIKIHQNSETCVTIWCFTWLQQRDRVKKTSSKRVQIARRNINQSYNNICHFHKTNNALWHGTSA